MSDVLVSPEVQRVFDLQKANRWNVAAQSANQRIRRLLKLKAAIWAHRQEIHQAVWEDFRKSPDETDITEIFPVLAEINHTVKHLRKWMKPTRVGTPLALLGTHSEVRYEPKGMVLILSPWNYPINLLLNPLVAALAAGNCVIIKPSSKVASTARFLKGFFDEIFPEDEVALIEGDSSVANQLLELPFDHIFFTGSPRIGKVVMKAAARHLASVTLELGGKSPVVADSTADPLKLAQRVMWGKLINAGQTCVAPDYLLLHESLLAPFLQHAKAVVAARYGETEAQRKASPDFCRIVSDDQVRNLQRVLQETITQGATVEMGGEIDASQRYIAPTILTGITQDSAIMRDEIFGPILPVLTFSSLDEAIAIIRSKEKPLALYLFSNDDAAIDQVLSQTTAGGSCINTVVLHLANPDLPFGGIGNSGMGNYHGLYGFKALSHERAVLRQGWFDSLKAYYPPYIDAVKRRIAFAMKYFG